MLKLVEPSVTHKESFLEAVREAQAAGVGQPDTLAWDLEAIEKDFEIILTKLNKSKPPAKLPEGRVPSETLWLVDDEHYIGRVNIRHELNEKLRQFDGHIGYEIRPSEQRKGHGKRILAMALKRARKLGIVQVLMSCDVDNIASRKIIEANGGVMEGGEHDVSPLHDKPIYRFWIDNA